MLNAALDGELDAMGMAAFEAQCECDRELAARYGQSVALRNALRHHAAGQIAPAALRDRIAGLAARARTEGAATPAVKVLPPNATGSRLALVASIVCAFLLGALASHLATLWTAKQPAERLAMLLVDDHRRALLARAPIDIESTDRHTVKPWFDARLALSPNVVDLSAADFTLVGGRADVVDGLPAPTIVYRLREHLISVTALPATRMERAPADAVNGYEMLDWRDGGFAYWAVSDVPRADLERFAAAFRAAQSANEGSR